MIKSCYEFCFFLRSYRRAGWWAVGSQLLYYHQYSMCQPDITYVPCHLQALGTVLSIWNFSPVKWNFYSPDLLYWINFLHSVLQGNCLASKYLTHHLNLHLEACRTRSSSQINILSLSSSFVTLLSPWSRGMGGTHLRKQWSRNVFGNPDSHIAFLLGWSAPNSQNHTCLPSQGILKIPPSLFNLNSSFRFGALEDKVYHFPSPNLKSV